MRRLFWQMVAFLIVIISLCLAAQLAIAETPLVCEWTGRDWFPRAIRVDSIVQVYPQCTDSAGQYDPACRDASANNLNPEAWRTVVVLQGGQEIYLREPYTYILLLWRNRKCE